MVAVYANGLTGPEAVTRGASAHLRVMISCPINDTLEPRYIRIPGIRIIAPLRIYFRALFFWYVK